MMWLRLIWNWIRDPNNLTAISTSIIAAFTIVLAWVGYCQARLIRKSIDLARQEFIAAHRPKLRMRRVSLIRPFLPDTHINIRFEAANIGDSQATVVELGFDAYIEGTLFNAAPRPPPIAIDPVPPGRELHMTGTGRAFAEAEIDAIEIGASVLRLLGIINYRDDNNVLRSTSFSRIYEPTTGRFAKVADTDAEADREFEN
jgi:hypothetical protein